MQNYKTMSPTDLAAWQAEVHTYLTVTHPSLQHVTAWPDMPPTFEADGCRLAMAIVRARDIARNPRAYKAPQAIKLIASFLKSAVPTSHVPAAPAAPVPAGGVTTTSPAPAHTPVAHVPAGGVTTPSPATSTAPAGGVTTPSPATTPRGKHLTEYINMLPPSLVTATANLNDLYLQQSSLARDSDKLADAYISLAATGNTAMMAEIQAKAAPINQSLVEVNKQIRALWSLVDTAVAYYQKNGHPIPESTPAPSPSPVQSLSPAPAGGVPTPSPANPSSPTPVPAGGASAPSPATPTLTKPTIDAIEDPAEQYRLKTARIESNKKYLRRTDLADTPEWRAQVRLRAQELLDWDCRLSKRIRENLERAGIHDL